MNSEDSLSASVSVFDGLTCPEGGLILTILDFDSGGFEGVGRVER